MTRSREMFQAESTQSLKSKDGGGFYISKNQACLFSLFFLTGLAAAACLTYFITTNSLKNENSGNSLDDDDFRLSKVPLKRDAKKLEDVRLPKLVVPYFYEIKLIPFLYESNFTFNGEVKILVNVTGDTNNITLHAKDLEIEEGSVKVTEINGNPIPVIHLSNDTEKQFFILHTKEVIKNGHQYEVEIKFTGYLNDELNGFYRSHYMVGNETRWLATTQFEPTHARRAFPCFDEPALKSQFKIFIGRPVNMTSVSNMPLQTTGNPVSGLPDYVWDEYQTSVPMSTYIVAFLVSDFDNITNGKNFSIWARSSAINQAKYALEIGPKILKHFESYFGIDFPLPKLDMAAIPDFELGGMENWGLITYRETALLFEEAVSSIDIKEGIASIISHELAHQWFGNLVTPSWWTDLWLNEGFASYVEFLGVEAVEPSWKIMDRFVLYETHSVFVMDSLKNSHKISINVYNPEEIDEIFDVISYRKGSSIIRMMDHFLTTEVFKRGLKKYLNRHKYSTSEQDDLWTALTEQGQQDGVLTKSMTVKTIMDTWTLQTGYPVITVLRDYNKGIAIITQERFLLSKSESEELKEKVLWWVPITYATSEDLNFQSTFPLQWMKQEDKIVIDALPLNNSWVIFNTQQTGFYRVNYDLKNWELLTEYLKNQSLHQSIHPINRAQIINDAMNLARAELLSYDVALNITTYLMHELEFVPWKAAIDAFSYVSDMLFQTAGFDKFKIYLLKIMNGLYNNVGFEDHPADSWIMIHKREMTLKWACFLEHPNCVENAVKRFANWKARSDPDRDNPIPPNLKSIIYCTAIKNGDESDWNFAWKRFKKSNVASEKEFLLSALGCSRQVWILRRALEWSFTNSSGIRKQDVHKLFGSIAFNPAGQLLAFNFVLEQWDRIRTYIGNNSDGLKSIIQSSTWSIISQMQLKQLIEFSEEHRNEFGSASRTVDQSIEKSKANIRWKDKNYDTIMKWLDSRIK